jgi:hypothetical protein
MKRFLFLLAPLWALLLSALAAADRESVTFCAYNLKNYLGMERFVKGARVPDIPKPEKEIAAVVKFITDIKPDALVFTRRDGTPVDIVIAAGSLRVDGRAVAIGAADRQRLIDIEHGVREALPEVKAIAHEAIAIAFEAVAEVSAAFA